MRFGRCTGGRNSARQARAALSGRHAELARQVLLAAPELLGAEALLAAASRRPTDARYQQHLLLALGPHNDDPRVWQRLLALAERAADDVYLNAGLRAALHGQEARFVVALSRSGRWNEAKEAQARLMERLATQSFANATTSDSLTGLLDLVAASEAPWLGRAVLGGLFAATRTAYFERAVLAQPHPLFARGDESALWPAIAKARQVFTWPGDTLAAALAPLTAAQQQLAARGESYYRERCATCHGAQGEGVVSLAPPLAGSARVTQRIERLARIILHGLRGPLQADGVEWNAVMPGHEGTPGFDHEAGAGLITYLQRAWGHSGRPVDVGFVAEIAKQSEGRALPWTLAELATVPTNTHFAEYAGVYASAGSRLAFSYDGQDLVIDAGIFSGTLTQTRTHHFHYPPRDMRFEFEADGAGGMGVWVRSEGGARLLSRLESGN